MKSRPSLKLRAIHPFPARMAPELALNALNHLPANSLILDPMAGSGTVLRQAVELGHRAVGFDLDPLAVLMSKVWTTRVDDQAIAELAATVIEHAREVDLRRSPLPWISGYDETATFIKYWFATEQRKDLARLAFVLHSRKQEATDAEEAVIDVLRIALSRIIVTKEQAASLARDTSHSRPHKVAQSSNFNVFEAYERSVEQLRQRLKEAPLLSAATVHHGDARRLTLADKSIDAVMTSPPYLNAIDYLRGHRMSLVWLGHRLGELRNIRSSSIGAERAADKPATEKLAKQIHRVAEAMVQDGELTSTHKAMVHRYAHDLLAMTSEVSRVLKAKGRATFVVGNSCLRGSFIKNSAGVDVACKIAGLHKLSEFERDLPQANRYLPMTSTSLGKRMRTETVLTFVN